MVMRQRRLNIPPYREAMTEIPNAFPANPFLAIWNPSMTVAEAEGVPGIFKRIAETAPPVIPPMYSPSIMLIAVTGPITKVMGRINTIPMLMVSPGRAPTTKPRITPTVLARRACQLKA